MNLYDLLKLANDLGVWDMLQAVGSLVLIWLGLRYFVLPRRHISQLDIAVKAEPKTHPQATYEKSVRIRIYNATGRTLVLSAAYLCTAADTDEMWHADALRDTRSRKVQVKFPVLVYPASDNLPKTEVKSNKEVREAGNSGPPAAAPPTQFKALYSLKEVEHILRSGEETFTTIPLDDNQDIPAANGIIRRAKLGVFECRVTWLGDEPKVQKWHVRL